MLKKSIIVLVISILVLMVVNSVVYEEAEGLNPNPNTVYIENCMR